MKLLGGHEVEGPLGEVIGRLPGQVPGYTEIKNLQSTIAGDEDILRLEVTVHDPVTMGKGHRRQQLEKEVFLEGRPRPGLKTLVKGSARHKFLDKDILPFILDDLKKACNIGMMDQPPEDRGTAQGADIHLMMKGDLGHGPPAAMVFDQPDVTEAALSNPP